MAVETTQKINVRQTAEWEPLRTVVLALANPLLASFESMMETVDEALMYQLEKNNFRLYDADLVHREQHQFIAGLKAEGVTVLLADPFPGSASQHYTRDIGFVIDDLFVWARMQRERRAQEQPKISSIVDRLERVASLDAGRIEGGDVMVNGPDELIIGYGEETSPEGVDALRRVLAAHGIEREILTLDMAERGTIHLDTKFNIIGPKIAIFDPEALAPHSRREIERRFDLIAATAEETRQVRINTLVFGLRKLAMSTGSDRLAEEVSKRGIEPVMFDYDEVNAMPGSFRCTTLPLVRGE